MKKCTRREVCLQDPGRAWCRSHGCRDCPGEHRQRHAGAAEGHERSSCGPGPGADPQRAEHAGQAQEDHQVVLENSLFVHKLVINPFTVPAANLCVCFDSLALQSAVTGLLRRFKLKLLLWRETIGRWDSLLVKAPDS